MKPEFCINPICFLDRAYRALLACGLLLVLSCLQVQAAEETSPAPVEMRGILTLSSESSFSLRKKHSGQVFWIQLGQERNGVKALQFDVEQSTLTVGIAGTEYDLSLIEAKDDYRWVVKSAPTPDAVEEEAAAPQRPPRPVRLQAIQSAEHLAERRERAQRIREARGLTSGSNAAMARQEASASGAPDQTNAPSGSTPEVATSDTLELQKGAEHNVLSDRRASSGAYRGRYVVRTPRREPAAGSNY